MKGMNLVLLSLFFTGSYDVFADSTTPEKKEKLKNTRTISSFSEDLKLILGQKEHHYFPRVRAIHALPHDLPPDQVQACYDFLHQKIENQQLKDLEFNGLKNELVWSLIRQKQKPEELSAHLVKMYYDKSYDTTWRDYCVQFFAKWYPDAPKNKARQDMVTGLWDALKNERQNRIAGTASSMLCFLAHHDPAFDKTQVSAEALEALTDPKTAKISKVALLQTCAELGNKKALQEARVIMKSEKDPLLRASAIAAVGRLGDKSDISELKRFESSRDIRLLRPAKAAIEKIQAKK